MKRARAVYLFAFAITAVVSLAMAAEIRVVDATVPVRNRLRPPTAGHFGSTGYELPLQVRVDVISPGSDGLVDVTLTNVGKMPLQLPISVQPRDLEPDDPNASYAVVVLGIYITRDSKKESILPGRVDLYGSSKFPETMDELRPQESVRVITRMLLGPGVSAGPVSSRALRAHVVLENQKVSTKGGQTSEETTEEIGRASCRERV